MESTLQLGSQGAQDGHVAGEQERAVDQNDECFLVGGDQGRCDRIGASTPFLDGVIVRRWRLPLSPPVLPQYLPCRPTPLGSRDGAVSHHRAAGFGQDDSNDGPEDTA